MRLSITGALAALVTLAVAADITLYLPPKPNPFTLPATTHATLTSLHHRHSAPLSAVNTFVFRNVTEGESYLADIYCPGHAYHPLRVDIGPAGEVSVWETYRGNDWGNKGEALEVREGSYGKGVELRSLGAKNYFIERPRFSVLTILKNPMILMGVVTMGMFVGMPYLMNNMDPEIKAEFEQRQRDGPMGAIFGAASGQQQQESPIGNFDMAAFLAGSKKDGGGNGGSSGKGQGVKR
ncbi:hypothetical protein LIA77_03330 [Sarocladium implicatum]|nr:hypothetical protein LIA77_03330 [Sarocladium implicatum]